MYLARDRTSVNRNDFGRIEMQNKLMKATFDQMAQAKMIMKAPQLYSKVSDMVNTDLAMVQITALALVGADMDVDDINFHPLQGSFARDKMA